MKKTIMTTLSLILAITMITLAGCSSTTVSTSAAATAAASVSGTTAGTAQAGTTAASTTAAAGQKVFTLDELKTYDGKNGNPAYVAVNGIVYDVTNVKAWANGTHQGLTAGQDLSSAIGNSPHGTSVLDGLTVVGTLG